MNDLLTELSTGMPWTITQIMNDHTIRLVVLPYAEGAFVEVSIDGATPEDSAQVSKLLAQAGWEVMGEDENDPSFNEEWEIWWCSRISGGELIGECEDDCR